MTLKNLFATVVIMAVGGMMALRILQMEPGDSESSSHGHGEEDAHEEEFERGPHGGRLLESGPLALEITIFEGGVPPHFRVYPFLDGAPVDPESITLEIDLQRLGDRVDRITFAPEAEYLRGQQVVYEPHSFDVFVRTQLGEREATFEFESHEGRVTLSPEAANFASLGLDTIGPRVIRDVVSLPGAVAMNQDRVVHVVPRIPGLVQSVHKNLGEAVARDEILAVIDSRELADAKSEYLAALERRDLAKSRYTREESLYQKEVSSEDDYLTAKESLAETEIRVRSARQKLAALGLDEAALAKVLKEPDTGLTHYEIRSPLAGTVIEKHIAGGEGVSADADIFLLADLSTVWVEVTVYSEDLRNIRAGLRVVVHSEDLEREAEGVVSYISSVVGEDTRSATAIVELPNPDGVWRPGLFVTADVVAEETTVPMAVPVDAVQPFRDFDVVFAKYGDTYEICMVELGRTDGEWVEVLSGITPGQTYVAANSYMLKADIEKSGAAHDH